MTQMPLRRPTPPINQANRSAISTGTPFLSAKKRGHRAILYGTGGIGKTRLTCHLPGKTRLADVEESMGVLAPVLDEIGDIRIPDPIEHGGTWQGLRDELQKSGWEGTDNIVLDSGTVLEQWATVHVLKTIRGEKGKAMDNIEEYGWGKGYKHIFDTFLNLLADLDRHVREGRNVIIIAHEIVSVVPNPKGEDWKRYEPRLQSSDKASVKLRLKEWADHVLFMSYDITVGEDGKATGNRTRSLYTAERPFCMAKSRTTDKTFDIDSGPFDWTQILK